MTDRKTILYLDQMYVSNMAKALYLPGFADPAANEYLELYRLIIEKSRENKLICPSSSLHRSESDRSDRVKPIVWRVTDYLAAETKFVNFWPLLQRQVLGAALRFVGVTDDWTPNRQSAFMADPDRFLSEKFFDEPIQGHIPTAEEWLDFENEMGGVGARQFEHFRLERISEGLDFAAETEFNRKQYAGETLVNPNWVVTTSGLNPSHPLLHSAISGKVSFINQVAGLLSEYGSDLASFADSLELLSIPIFEIRAKLAAADIVFHSTESPQFSFQTDLEMVSNYLPYVDILTTDAGIKERMRNSKLTEEWPAEVFSNRRRDRQQLIAMVAKL